MRARSRKIRRRPRLTITLVALALVLSVPNLAGAAPGGASGVMEPVNEGPFVSRIWSEACGFEVMRQNVGHERIWEEPRGNRVLFRGVFAIKVTLTGPTGRTYTFQDAGTDRETLLADGSEQLAIIGRSFPVNSTGRLVVVDGDVVRISGRTAYDPAEICAKLAP
jgi:hypothetical protein